MVDSKEIRIQAEIPKSLGPYRIDSKIGQGGMGAVYKGFHETLERPVAIKILPPEFAADPEYVSRFLREARVVATIRHENVIQVFDAGVEGDKYYMVMELVEGCSLGDYVDQKGALDEKEGLELMLHAAKGLAAAHEKGLVHRDIKPDNILLDLKKNALRILDFGLVREVSSNTQLTTTGQCLGTPQYMSPEQADGEQADARTDLYSLGATFFQVFTGKVPFEGTTVMNQLFKHKFEAPPVPFELNPKLGRSLSNLILTLLAKSRDDRPNSAKDLVKLIQDVQAGKKIPDPPVFQSPVNSDLQRFNRGDFKAGSPLALIWDAAMAGGTRVLLMKKRNPWAWTTGIVAGLVALGLVAGSLWFGRNDRMEDPPEGFSGGGQPVVHHPVIDVSADTNSDSVPARNGAVDEVKKDPPLLKSDPNMALEEITLEIGSGLHMAFRKIPPGTFQMGSSPQESGRSENEKPHDVVISKPFYIGKHEVTQEQYDGVFGRKTIRFEFEGSRHPADRVSWHKAQEFCRLLRSRIKKEVRLPTEAEWEYACRAGMSSAFNTGAKIGPEQANFNASEAIWPFGSTDKKENANRRKTVPVGSFPSNPWGLFDMHGNVWEWCEDWFEEVYAHGSVTDPKGPISGERKVQRGGSWSNSSKDCRSAKRAKDKPEDCKTNYGFRIVVEIE